MPGKTVSFRTFGCKQNQYDTDFLRESFEARGFTVVRDDAEQPDVVVVNTCAVTSKGAAKCRQAIRAAARSGSKVVVTGCYSQIAPGEVESIPGVIAVGGIRGRAELVEMVERALRSGEKVVDVVPHEMTNRANDESGPRPAATTGQPEQAEQPEHAKPSMPASKPFARDQTLVEQASPKDPVPVSSTAQAAPKSGASKISPQPFEETPVKSPSLTRAFLKIQEGCGDFCAYCIVPYARGPSRSRPANRVLNEARALIGRGYKEIVLTGTHIGLYGREDVEGQAEFPPLPELIRMLCGLDGLVRLRVSSLEPHDVDDDLLECLRLPQVCAHLHLPMQSGSDRVLRAMGRRYDVQCFLEVVRKIRMIAPDAGITTDIIVGFPGETVGDFEDTLKVAGEAAFSRIHAFKFSPRPGTRARGFSDQVPDKDKDARISRLLTFGKELSASFHRKHISRVLEVLVEDDRDGDGSLTGVTRNYIRCDFAGGDELKGRLVPVLVRSAGPSSVKAEIVG